MKSGAGFLCGKGAAPKTFTYPGRHIAWTKEILQSEQVSGFPTCAYWIGSVSQLQTVGQNSSISSKHPERTAWHKNRPLLEMRQLQHQAPRAGWSH